MAKIEKWASGWNHPSLPGQVFGSENALVAAVKKAAGTDAHLEYIRSNMDRMSREELFEQLQWNDRNGWYTDKVRLAEGWEPLTEEEAKQAAREVFSDPGNMSRSRTLVSSCLGVAGPRR